MRSKLNVDTTQKLPAVLSLCTGYGGIERGLELAGVKHRVIAHVEIEAFAIANLVAKMEAGELDAAPVWTNLKTLPVESFRDRVDILTGGYPCQPFSAAGKRLGEEDPRHLWPYIKEIIRAVRPVRCFFENVEGHISLGLREVISDLESLGYTTAWGIFSAREVGAPHQRKRVYIMAYSSGQRSRDHAGQTEDEGWESSSERRETLRQGDREERAVRVVATGKDGANSVADTVGEGLQGGERSGRDVSEDREGGAGSHGAAPERGHGRRASEPVAYTDSSGLGQGNKEDAKEPSKQSDGSGFRSGVFPNSNNQGLEGRLQGGRTDTQGRQEQEIRCAAQRSDWGSGDGQSVWAPEPRLGRVVDGCANRVDRIRLLGNGVVPQCAARAWAILEFENEDKN
tara:strand:+ start:1307 stop:2503 length:1197 start_codon:yes stop_codon:yes gene_type:complete